MDIVTPVVDLICRLWVCCSPSLTNLCNLKRNIISLGSTIEQLKSKKTDVTNKIDRAESDLVEPKERTGEVKNWLTRVEAIEQEVAGILEQTQIRDSRGCCCCYCPSRSNNCWTDYKLSNLVIEKLSTVKELISEGEFSVVAERCPHEQFQEIPTAAVVVGMEPKLEELWKFVNEDDQVRILGIYGMGGVGKTTLLKKLNNEFPKRSHNFDFVIWAVVSKDLNLKNFQKQITDSLRLNLQGEPDLNTTAKEIFRVLRKKKFVLLLDDIWQRIDLQSIGVPAFDSNSTHETNKSMVVFTTRSEGVCGQMEAHRRMKVDCLNWSEAWSLFQDKLGTEVINGHPQIPELATVVANECRGLPLALVTLGRTMASKKTVHEWRHAIIVLRKSASEFEGMVDHVLPILKFSYDNLRNDKIKSCFLYCSLFPEDHHIDTEELIDYWIAEGYIDDFENIDEARDQGHDIIGNLRSVSLLEESYCILGLKGVKMHDVVRDLAIWIVSDYGRNKGKYLADVGLEPKLYEWEKAEKILVMNVFCNNINLSTNCSNLSTLIILSPAEFSLICENTPKLRVLRISGGFISPANIGQLSELRYLDLRDATLYLYPNELKSLAKLMFLRMGRSSIKLPSGAIPCLAQLRVLDMYDSDFKDWEMEGCASIMELESLKHLNELGIRIGNLVALQKLVSTPKFQLITTRLCILRCEGITSVSLSKSSHSLSLSNFKNLRKLGILGCEELQELRISPWGIQTLESLLLYSLPKLEIVWDDKQMVLPAADQLKEEQLLCISNLQNVYISGCESIKNLTWLTYAQDLRRLTLVNMDGIEEIISDGFLVDDDHTKLNLFSNLTNLVLSGLGNLKSICSNSLAFPVLKDILIVNCPKLKKLPLDNNSNKNNTLKSISGKKEWWDSLEWDDDTVKDRFSSVTSFIRFDRVENQPLGDANLGSI